MRTWMRSKVTLLFIVVAVLVAVPVVAAMADQLRDELVANNANQNIATITQNDPNGFVNTYHLDATGSGANVNGQCDVDNTHPVTFSIDTPTGVTASPNTLTFKQCGDATTNTQDVTFTSDTPDTTGYIIDATQTSSLPSPAIATGNATFTLKVNPDTQAPTVANNTPTGTSEPVGTNATATFSEKMDSSTFTNSTFTLVGPSGAVAASRSLSTDGKTATLNPTNDLAANTTYTATVTTGVKDLAGNALAQNKTWTFKTAAPADSTPPVITKDVTGTVGNNGWYTTNVGVDWTVTDNESAISSQSSGCADFSVTSDQNATTYTCTATSGGGTSTDSVTIKRDATNPTITASVDRAPNANGWYNDDVTVSFNCSDSSTPGSGLAAGACPANVVLGEGANQSVSRSVTDQAGNSASATKSGINIDKSAPTITASVDRAANANGWYNDDVTVSFNCSDTGGSGLAAGACPANVVLGEGANQSVSRSVTDQAGNSASATKSGINIDKSAPEVTPGAATTDPNTAGWYKNDVTVNFTASDGLSGLADPTKASFTQNTSGEGLAVKANSGDVYDKAGNKASAQSAGFNIDKTPPTITASLNKTPAASGWFNGATGAPTVSFQCADALSGVDSCSAAYTFANGADQSRTGTVVDVAGNSNTDSVNNVDVDLDAPNAPTATTNPLNPVANSGGFFKNTVSVSFGGSTDVGPSGNVSYTADTPFSTTGTHNYSGKATDAAGNVSTDTTGSVKVDADDPTVSISGCPTAPVTLNSNQSISVSAADQATGSGLVSDPSGSVSLDTGSVGPKSKTITVEDKVGHSKSATCSYSVKYGFSGFLQPINDTAHMISLGPDVSTFKAGSTVPVKFYLTDANGNRVQAANAQWIAPQKGGATTQAVDESVFTDPATTGTLYKYDATAQQSIYNWSTKGVTGGFYYKIGVKLDDGQTYTTYISLR